MKMSTWALGMIVVAGCLCLLILVEQQGQTAEAQSQCVLCHTSPVKLIKITREINKNNPVKENAKSKGEG
ncbi:hypothetical protein [Desulfoplanes sp.]